MLVALKPDLAGAEVYWGPASGSADSTYQLKSMDGHSDMKATWQFNSDTQATVTVDSCTTNCLWQSGQVVTLIKFFGDMKSKGSATRVPKTGQTQCRDTYGGEIDCTGTGQDGETQFGVSPVVRPAGDYPNYTAYTVYGWTGIRFTDNLDGTVTDNLTGLIWLKNATCFDLKPWTIALNDCNNLANGSCGLTDGSLAGDWRLPNINELHSLVDPTQHNPALTAIYPFTGVRSAFDYWSSTTYPDFPSAAWSVDMDTGSESVNPKDYYGVCLWPVRSGN